MYLQAFWERKHDTHALLAWGGDRIVLVFRGTASFANVLADLAVSCSLPNLVAERMICCHTGMWSTMLCTGAACADD